MDEEELRQYLLRAAAHGYADKQSERTWAKGADGSTTITHADGPWRLHDNFFGGEPYGGREVVFLKDRPVWIMVYYGVVDPTVVDFRAVYSFLQDALRDPDPLLPVRGPRVFEGGGLRYEAEWEGALQASRDARLSSLTGGSSTGRHSSEGSWTPVAKARRRRWGRNDSS